MDKNTSNQVIPIKGQTDIIQHHGSQEVIDAYGYPQEPDDFDIKKLIGIFWKRRWIIASITAVVYLFTMVQALSITPVYKATSTIKIDQDTDRVVNYDVYAQNGRYGRDWNFIQTQVDILTSRALARRVIDQLGLEEKLTNPKVKQTEVAEQVATVKATFRDTFKGLVEDIKSGVGYSTVTADPAPDASTLTQEQNNDNGSDEWIASDDEIITTTFEDEETSDLIDPREQLGQVPIELTFLGRLSVEQQKESNIISISYIHPEPEVAALVANAVAENYIQMNMESKGDSTAYAKEFLKEQLKITRSKLEKSEKELVRYENKHQIIHTGENNSIINSELQELSTAYLTANRELIDSESEYRQKNKVSGSVRVLDSAVVQSLKEKQVDLETKYAEMLQIYKPAYPLMVELRNQINMLKKRAKQEQARIRTDSSRELKSDYLAAKEKVARLKKQLNAKKKEIMTLKDKNVGYTTLRREVDTNRQIYDGLLQRVKEVGVASGAVTNDAAILDQAYVPFSHYLPNTQQKLSMGLLMGLLLGFGAAFLLEILDDSIKSAEELEELTGLPVIGYFPYIRNLLFSANPLLIHEKKYSEVSESFRSLAVDLQFSTEHGTPQILHLTSTTPNEGKSCSSINLSTVFAQQGKRTLLVDCDLRKPSMHSYLGLHNRLGLTNVLVGQCELEDAYQEVAENFTLLSAGVSPSNPVKMLASERMLEILDDVSADFDQIILDSPPILGMADALLLSNRAHATLLVVSAENTRKKALQDALKRLKRGFGNPIGILFSKVKSKSGSYYGYNDYYSYGSDSGVDMTPLKHQEKETFLQIKEG